MKEQQLRQETVGNTLRDMRIAAGLTQRDLARSLRYSTAQFVSNWERGISLPPLRALPKILRILGGSPRALMQAMGHYQDAVLKRKRQELAGLFRNA